MTTVFVSRGHSVLIDKMPHGPGSTVTLPDDEAVRLASLGFVQDTPPVLAPPATLNPAGIGHQHGGTVQGPNFRA